MQFVVLVCVCGFDFFRRPRRIGLAQSIGLCRCSRRRLLRIQPGGRARCARRSAAVEPERADDLCGAFGHESLDRLAPAQLPAHGRRAHGGGRRLDEADALCMGERERRRRGLEKRRLALGAARPLSAARPQQNAIRARRAISSAPAQCGKPRKTSALMRTQSSSPGCESATHSSASAKKSPSGCPASASETPKRGSSAAAARHIASRAARGHTFGHARWDIDSEALRSLAT